MTRRYTVYRVDYKVNRQHKRIGQYTTLTTASEVIRNRNILGRFYVARDGVIVYQNY